MNPRALFITLGSLSLAAASTNAARAGAWAPDSDPFVIGPRFDSVLENLSLSAKLPPALRPWSGPFWADRRGSIAYRWQTGKTLWQVVPPTAAEIRAMTAAEISRLSPAEKIDIVRGRYDYPTVAIIRGFARAEDPRWEGVCTGWAQSAV